MARALEPRDLLDRFGDDVSTMAQTADRSDGSTYTIWSGACAAVKQPELWQCKLPEAL